MGFPVKLEIIGLKNSDCSPFPCNESRTCGLVGCERSGGKLTFAVEELKSVLFREYGDRVQVTLVLLDNGTPDYVKNILETEYPPLPIILVNGKLTRIGRIALYRIKKEIDAYFKK